MRLVIARCSVDYVGRLSAHLPMATRLLIVKADGSVLVHSDGGSYKPLNWMSPPCRLEESPGSWVFGGGLHAPSTATVLRPKDGDVLITDGPYAEGKEHLGGFTIIKAPDLDAALEWARRYALVTTLPIEVRPFQGEAED